MKMKLRQSEDKTLPLYMDGVLAFTALFATSLPGLPRSSGQQG